MVVFTLLVCIMTSLNLHNYIISRAGPEALEAYGVQSLAHGHTVVGSVQGYELVTLPVGSKGLRAQLEELVAPVQPSRTLLPPRVSKSTFQHLGLVDL